MVTLPEDSGYVPSPPNIRMMPTDPQRRSDAPTDQKKGLGADARSRRVPVRRTGPADAVRRPGNRPTVTQAAALRRRRPYLSRPDSASPSPTATRANAPLGNAFTRAPHRADSALGRPCPVTALLDDGMTQDWQGQAGGSGAARSESRPRLPLVPRPTPARESRSQCPASSRPRAKPDDEYRTGLPDAVVHPAKARGVLRPRRNLMCASRPSSGHWACPCAALLCTFRCSRTCRIKQSDDRTTQEFE